MFGGAVLPKHSRYTDPTSLVDISNNVKWCTGLTETYSGADLSWTARSSASLRALIIMLGVMLSLGISMSVPDHLH